MALYPTGTIFTDSLFQDAVAQAATRKDLAEIRSGEDWTEQQYNYGVNNAANPYSRQALLNRSQRIQGVDSMNAGARSPGGVRSGAYKVRNANMVFGQGQEQDALQRDFQSLQKGYARQKEDILSAYNQDLYNAGTGSVQRKLESDRAAGLQASANIAAGLNPDGTPKAPEPAPSTGLPKNFKLPKSKASARRTKVLGAIAKMEEAPGKYYSFATQQRLINEARKKKWVA